MGERLLVLRRALQKVIKNYQPGYMVVERIFFGANSTSALSVGQARGVVLLTAQENKLPIFEYTGLEVKLTVADHGRADKKAIQTAVRRHLCVKNLPKPKDQIDRQVFRFRDDAYDAVAAAICHVLKQTAVSRKQKAEIT
jgi:crossover junction endodeoxyribonuclease RuvC